MQQDFLRGGVGISYKLGNGDGLVMVNSSNQTGKNTTWVFGELSGEVLRRSSVVPTISKNSDAPSGVKGFYLEYLI